MSVTIQLHIFLGPGDMLLTAPLKEHMTRFGFMDIVSAAPCIATPPFMRSYQHTTKSCPYAQNLYCLIDKTPGLLIISSEPDISDEFPLASRVSGYTEAMAATVPYTKLNVLGGLSLYEQFLPFCSDIMVYRVFHAERVPPELQRPDDPIMKKLNAMDWESETIKGSVSVGAQLLRLRFKGPPG